MTWIIVGIIAVGLWAYIANANSSPPASASQRRTNSSPAYNRDYVIGNICSMIDAEVDESGPELFGQGKLVISTEVRSLGWIGPSATPRDGYKLLLDLNKIPSDEKILLNIMLERVAEAQGMAKTVAADMAALTIHKCMMEASELYKNLDYNDPRLR